VTKPVVLINVFAVSAEMEAEFLKTWHECECMRTAPGFIDTTLHHSLDTDTRFRFVNIAH
jgi:heme-degrading monooxygenase HmoA